MRLKVRREMAFWLCSPHNSTRSLRTIKFELSPAINLILLCTACPLPLGSGHKDGRSRGSEHILRGKEKKPREMTNVVSAGAWKEGTDWPRKSKIIALNYLQKFQKTPSPHDLFLYIWQSYSELEMQNLFIISID